MAAIVESSDDAIIGKTFRGIVESWNPGAERIYGYSAEEMIGRPVSVLVPPGHDDDVPLLLEKVRQGERVDHYETVRQAKGRRLIDVSLTISPIRDSKGDIVGASTISRDVTERKRAEQKLQNMLRGLVEGAPDAMVIVGADGRIALVNRQTEELFGYPREELLGQPVELLVPERSQGRHPDHRDRYSVDPKVRPMGAGLELYARRKDGSEFPVEISLSPMRTENGTTVSAAIRDVTERKRAERELKRVLVREREAAVRLRGLDRLKDEFLATVSHELRTPLTVISALAEVLRGSPDRDDRGELLERIFQNSSEMGGMIEQLLDYSRLEAGKVAMEARCVCLRDAMVRCIDLANGTMGNRRISLEVQEELRVRADERALERIVVNLLSNAAKFSPDPSTIRIAASAQERCATVAVHDQGIGIAAGEQTRVFERFYQGAAVPGKRGTGVGLSIVSRYVELLGGEVWVQSEPGEGSTFSFTLPLADSQR
ncbi:MAG: PAS domain-containing sensor histidine kinase [Solirubrobacterales bacterium]|nr:PAS domain-containing sensor histidine kinase [Solirubrobacterales bacterium]